MADSISTSKVTAATKKLQQALMERYQATSGIKREGSQIIIPAHMSWRDAAEAILSHAKKQEEDVQTLSEFNCHPHDGLVALVKAIKGKFGELIGAESESMFGKIPGKTYTVPISYTETLTVPVGDAEIPGVPIKMSIQPYFSDMNDESSDNDLGGSLRVVFAYKRMYEPLIKDIEEEIRIQIQNNSIFRGKAIDSRFNFMNVDTFDPSRVVYSRNEKRTIDANILAPIVNTDSWVKSGSQLRRGVLLYGEYGTGKTLTALLTGQSCVRHGWTFINVLPGDDINRALRFAKRYEPAVVFFEDIDNDTKGDRNEHINNILNTIDGVISKSAKVITILTTNHINKISRGMLRPGRLDSIIEMGKLDNEAIIRLVQVAGTNSDGTSIIEGELDNTAICEAAKGYMPAYISEAVTKAKAYALTRENNDEALKITSEDIVDALIELREQYNLMRSDQVVKEPDVDSSIQHIVQMAVAPMAKELTDITKKLG